MAASFVGNWVAASFDLASAMDDVARARVPASAAQAVEAVKYKEDVITG
jgi:hypothetical protein